MGFSQIGQDWRTETNWFIAGRVVSGTAGTLRMICLYLVRIVVFIIGYIVTGIAGLGNREKRESSRAFLKSFLFSKKQAPHVSGPECGNRISPMPPVVAMPSAETGSGSSMEYGIKTTRSGGIVPGYLWSVIHDVETITADLSQVQLTGKNIAILNNVHTRNFLSHEMVRGMKITQKLLDDFTVCFTEENMQKAMNVFAQARKGG